MCLVFLSEFDEGEFWGTIEPEQFPERWLKIEYVPNDHVDADAYWRIDFVDPKNPVIENFEPADAMHLDVPYAPSHQ